MPAASCRIERRRGTQDSARLAQVHACLQTGPDVDRRQHQPARHRHRANARGDILGQQRHRGVQHPSALQRQHHRRLQPPHVLRRHRADHRGSGSESDPAPEGCRPPRQRAPRLSMRRRDAGGARGEERHRRLVGRNAGQHASRIRDERLVDCHLGQLLDDPRAVDEGEARPMPCHDRPDRRPGLAGRQQHLDAGAQGGAEREREAHAILAQQQRAACRRQPPRESFDGREELVGADRRPAVPRDDVPGTRRDDERQRGRRHQRIPDGRPLATLRRNEASDACR